MKAAINALAMKLAMYPHEVQGAARLADAVEFATEFFNENAELFSAPAQTVGGMKAVPGVAVRDGRPPVADDPDQAIRPSAVFQPRQPGELMPHQQAAVAEGRQLCPNCQQPTNDHLPGCARVGTGGFPPMDPKARTKAPLPPAEA